MYFCISNINEANIKKRQLRFDNVSTPAFRAVKQARQFAAPLCTWSMIVT